MHEKLNLYHEMDPLHFKSNREDPDPLLGPIGQYLTFMLICEIFSLSWKLMFETDLRLLEDELRF